MKNLMRGLSLSFQAWLAKGHLKNNRVRASVVAALSLFALLGGSTFNALTAPEPAAVSTGTPDLVGTCNDPARLSCFVNLPEPMTEETASSTPVGFQLASVGDIAPAEGGTFLLVSNPTDLGTDSSDVGNTGSPGTVAFTFTGDNNGGGSASGGNQVTGGTGGLLQLAAFNPPGFTTPGGSSGGAPLIVSGKPSTPPGNPPNIPPSVTPPENPPEILPPAVLLPTPPCVSGLCPPGTDPDPIPPVVACASGNCPTSPGPGPNPDLIPPPPNPPGSPDPVVTPDPVITPVADNNPPINPLAVPEPAALALFGLGLLLIGLFRRKKHNS